MINATSAMRAFILDNIDFAKLVNKRVYGSPPGLPAAIGNPPTAVVIQQLGVSSDADTLIDTHRMSIRVYGPDSITASELFQQLHNFVLYPLGQPVNNRSIRGRWFLFGIEATGDTNVTRTEETTNWPVSSGTYLCKFNSMKGA